MSPALPNRPGVYLIKDLGGKIIYVGKANSIAKRLKQHHAQDSKLHGLIHDVDYIVTSSELEALILEAVLIKKHMPRYNVLLRDDKQYPYIKLTFNEEWPQLLIVRKVLDDGAKYFGPFTGDTARQLLSLTKKLFQIRWCRTFKKRNQPCFYFHLGKCLAPCIGNISKDEYLESVKNIETFLSGKFVETIKKIKQQMSAASDDQDYEAAAKFRDKLNIIEHVLEEQKVVSAKKEDKDIFHIETSRPYGAVVLLEIRDGKLTAKKDYFIKGLDVELTSELAGSLIMQNYHGALNIPPKVIVDINVENKIAKALSKVRGAAVLVKAASSKEDKGLLRMAADNSKVLIEEKLKAMGDNTAALLELKQEIGMDKLPYRIEAFDISTTMGIETVGSMVVFENGTPKKSDYRKFKIGNVLNDVACMRQVVMRRYTGDLSKQLNNPDLVLVDGGPTQLKAVMPFIPKGSVVISLAKRLEEVYVTYKKKPLLLSRRSNALKILQRLRDEAHRFAITFHKKRRAKRMFSA